VDEAALAVHKEEPHFQPWKSFEASGGVVSLTVVTANGVFFGGVPPAE